ncbi:ROK family transcriptional regulator [Amnibacterium endophyticum]|uniref:ROK family protein n=1 Tax=Amnibacterium endophyticum TaxID=2109337 RepID=A0ABW4LE91_9MICO
MQEGRRKTGNQASLREANRARIVAAVKQHGGLSQVELAGSTGLSPATVSNIVKELVASGVLHTAPTTQSGRRAIRVTLAHGLGLVAGVHVTERHLRVVLSDLSATVVSEHHMPLGRHHRPDQGLDTASMLVADMLESVDAQLDELVGVGLAVAAPVDAAAGRIASTAALRGWSGVDAAEGLGRRLARPVHLDNSANLIALAEWRLGAGRGKDDLIVIEAGDGIGAVVVVAGRLLRGHRGVAGELGHVVVDPHGPSCRCGARGCLEALAAAPAVVDGLDDPRITKLTDVLIRAVAGEQESIRAIGDAGRAFGLAAVTACNLLDPERIVVSGELARAGELLIGPLRHALEAGLLVAPHGAPDVVTGQLGEGAAALGAALLAIERAELPVGGHEPVTIERDGPLLAFTT